MNLREIILGINDKQRTPVEVPEWGVTLYVASLAAKAQIQFATAQAKYPDVPPGVMLVAFSAEDEAGNLVFSPDDIPALAEKRSDVITRLALALTKHDGANLEALQKNS